ncbi:MAG: hypothetical protein ABFR90_05935 [Planctomycetota bacterium]
MNIQSDIFEMRTLERRSGREYWTNSIENSAGSGDIVRQAADYLKTLDAQPVSIRLIGNQDSAAQADQLIRLAANEMGCPPLMMTQASSSPLQIQVHAVSGMRSEPLYFEDALIGRMFEDDFAAYYMLSMVSDSLDQSNYVQAKGVFEKAYKILTSLGMDFSHAVRTWLYAADILSWYDELNRARNEFFEFHGIYDKLVPASTGIGIDNPAQAALTAQLLAVKPKSDDVRIEAADSPLQNPALDYKSSFSRGVKVLAPDHRRLSVSGTASIDAAGETIHVDDAAAQVDLTMRVVGGILEKAGMEWADAVSSLVYFKRLEYVRLFDDYCRTHNITLPHVKIHADVCRDDLLFELELDAVKKA